MRLTRRMLLATAASVAIARAGTAAEAIRIGLSGPFTGGSACMGVCMRNGVRIAVAEINQAGGVLGRPILLIERDDKADTGLAGRIAQELINEQRVAATLGFINTPVALTTQRTYQDAAIPVITNVATGTLIARRFRPPEYQANFIFRTAANDAIQSAMIVDEAISRRGFRQPAILADATAYGQLGREDLERALASKGVPPVAEEKFNIGDTDMTSQLLRAKRAQADVLLTYGIGPELAQIANGMARLGWKLPMIGSWTLSMTTFIDAAGANGDGATMPQTFIQAPSTPKRGAFIAAYQNATGLDRIPSPVSAAQGYDSALLLAAAIAQAGSTDGNQIRAALENLRTTVEGVVTIYDKPFSATDHEAITPNIPVFGVVKGGRVVAAYPADIEAANAVRVKTRS